MTQPKLVKIKLYTKLTVDTHPLRIEYERKP